MKYSRTLQLALFSIAIALTVTGPLRPAHGAEPSRRGAEVSRQAGEPAQAEPADNAPVVLGAELLVPDNMDEPEHRVHWLLHDALSGAFAQTRTPEAAVEQAANAPLRLLKSQAVLDQIEQKVARVQVQTAPTPTAEPAPGIIFDIPMASHPLVDAYVEYFTTRGRWFFAQWLERADRYVPIMQKILGEQGVPKDLIYLAMIESGFSSSALSRSRALGFWQFMAPTAQLVGLHQTNWVDERRDFVQATVAAAKYLLDLYGQFKDWHLAWAAYNAGRGHIARVLNVAARKDFWGLLENRRLLREETRQYVPKILAAAIVAKDRERYGFLPVVPQNVLEYDELEVKDAVDLRVVARELEVTADSLRELNPALLYDLTPPGRPFTLRVPKGTGAQVATWLKDLPIDKRITYWQHRVVKGDTLGALAQRFGTTVQAMLEFNTSINPKRLRQGEMLIIPAVRNGVKTVRRPPKVPVASATPPVASPVAQKGSSRRIVVAQGDTLRTIAKRYGTNVATLRRINAVDDASLTAGSVLRLF